MPPPSHARRSLLLLPPAPSPPTYANLKAAYSSCLFTVLRELSHTPQRGQGAVILDVALPCDHLYARPNSPRSAVYSTTQSLVAGLYKLLCVIAAKEAIDTEDAEDVDPRILLLAYPRNGKLLQPSDHEAPELETQGPVIDLQTLARSSRSWDTVYAVQSEEGEGILKHFLANSKTERSVSHVRGGTVQVAAPDHTPPGGADATSHHLSVAVGGTFDHLHIGHKLLLTMFAFVLGRPPSAIQGIAPTTLTVGITGDELLKKKKYAEYLESWAERQQATHDFLSSILHFGQPDDARIRVEEKNEPGPNGHAVHVTYPSNLTIKYVEIWDPFGPTITDETISALVLSAETRSGGKAVNDKRAEKGWGPLEVFEVDVLDADEEGTLDETFQSKLSSTEIRRKRSEHVDPRSRV